MPKKTFQDVVSSPRSIRNVELPIRRKPTEKLIPAEEYEEPVTEKVQKSPLKKFERSISFNRGKVGMQDIAPTMSDKRDIESVSSMRAEEENTPDSPTYSYTYDEPKKTSSKLIYIASGVLIVILTFAISAFFKSAKITLTPRHETREVTGTFTAQKDVTTGLGFQIVTVSKESQTPVVATGDKQVNSKASGTIVIYNNNPVSQKLIATTRFQTSNNLIYRLISVISIPGKTIIGGKSVPGSAEAAVQADASGATYNIPLSDFTLPALKGDPKFKTIYARSKTPMTGGFAGTQKVVSQISVTAADAVLQSQLKDALNKEIVSEIPANFILFPGGTSYSFSETSQGKDTGSTTLLQKKGTAQAIILDKASLSQAIVSRVLPDTVGQNVKVDNLDSLTFAFATSTSNPTFLSQVSFSIFGNANFVWTFDQNKLKIDILGLSKIQAQSVIATNYKSVQEAWIEIRPFWNQTISSDPDKVNVINTLNK